MRLSIPFSEAIQIAKDKFGKEITLAAVNENTIKVGYVLKVKIPFTARYVSDEISIDVTYEKLVDEDVYLSFDGGLSLNLIMDGLRHVVPQLSQTELFELHDGNKVTVHLGKVEKLHDVLQKIMIVDVTFIGESIDILFGLK